MDALQAVRFVTEKLQSGTLLPDNISQQELPTVIFCGYEILVDVHASVAYSVISP